MFSVEIAELMNQDGKMMNWALKVNRKLELSQEDLDIASVIDVWAKEIGEGKRSAYELSQYIVRTVEPEVYNAPDQILDMLFDRGSIGEFDNEQANVNAKNRLLAIKSARSIGNVDKSYIDYSVVKPTWVHLQVDTEVSMEKLRKGGYKTVAELTVMAEEALKNKMFYEIFNALDAAITAPSAQGFTSASAVTMAAADDATGYLLDRGTNPMLIGLSTLIRPINKLSGYQAFLSNEMKNDLNKYGIIDLYNGVKLAPISAAKKLADDTPLLPTNRVIGIADKIGQLDMRGSLRVLQTPDNNREVIDLKITGFEFGYMFTAIEKVCKIVIS